MRILFLHPEDALGTGAWSHFRWDLIIDLGYASSSVYEDWNSRSGTRVLSIFPCSADTQGYRWISQVLARGRGRLLDRMGLDWWEILAVGMYQDLYALYLLDRIRPEIPEQAELFSSRPHLFSKALADLLHCPLHNFQTERAGVWRIPHMMGESRKLRPEQIVEIALDKWDPGFRVRRCFSGHRRAHGAEPVTLLPSAYSNVTRIALAYARQLPHRQFLLATTRRNAQTAPLPANVRMVPLAAYAKSSRGTGAEIRELQRAWREFAQEMCMEVAGFRGADRTAIWAQFPNLLKNGIHIRDAWENLLQCEPVRGVLCGDDLNHYTRLPLLLARHRDLNAVYCSHGALDGGTLFKVPYARSFLVKGEMELEYLQRATKIKADKVIIGAPGENPFHRAKHLRSEDGDLVFFSQPYEVEQGRGDEIYREVVPVLYAVARQTGRRLVIKLHPFESKQQRSELIASVLSGQRDGIEILSRVPPEEVISRAWCGVTVDSSVAVECALSGVPCFLCSWLDFSGMGYLQQFARSGAGQVISRASDLEKIPDLVRQFQTDSERARARRFWHPVDPDQLERILFGHVQPQPESESFTTSARQASLSPLLRGPESLFNKIAMSRATAQVVNRMFYPALGSMRYFQSAFTSTVSVVTYHGILPAGYKSEDGFLDDVLISAEAFRAQLRLLKKHYNVISPDRFLGWIKCQEELPKRAVVLTCDDGLLNHLTDMLPILHDERLECLFFATGSSLNDDPVLLWHTELYLLLRDAPLCSKSFSFGKIEFALAGDPDQRHALWLQLVKRLSALHVAERRDFLNQAAKCFGLSTGWWLEYIDSPSLRRRFCLLSQGELKQLSSAGMTIGAHTLTHPVLSQLTDSSVRSELADCRRTLADCLGKPVWALAYPFGDSGSTGAREFRIAKEAEYDCAFLNVPGNSDPDSMRYSFPRIHVNGSMSLAVYEAHISGMHDRLRNRFRTSAA